ncbi:MAG: MOSC domain-containing protein [Roseateles sp.]|uniref:MOSC domain-containing protein n=1 Tax=Roseateles sp. TaxID=1971397 RepID=UPI0040354A0F
MADLIARIAGLWRYPVKSCAGEAVETLKLGVDGWPEGDRGWGIADASGELTWMGAHPRLALVSARGTQGGGLTLEGEGRRLEIAADGGGAVNVRAWNGERQDFDLLMTRDAGDDAAALLLATTGEHLRLVRLSLEAQRRPMLNPLHIVGDGSLQAWAAALTKPLTGAVQRVRPNVLLSADDGGALPAFIEDMLIEARIGALTLRRTTPCVRCMMTTIDPATGIAQPLALDALTQLSAEREPGAPVQFGIYASGSGTGVLRVGDRVEMMLDFCAA